MYLFNDEKSKLRQKFEKLTDDEVKNLIERFLDDYYDWNKWPCLKANKDKMVITINRCSAKAPWDEFYKLISVRGALNFYEMLSFGINDYGECWIEFQVEHCAPNILYRSSIDEWLKKYLGNQDNIK